MPGAPFEIRSNGRAPASASRPRGDPGRGRSRRDRGRRRPGRPTARPVGRPRGAAARSRSRAASSVGRVVALGGESQVVRTGLGETRPALARARRTCVERRAARQVDDVTAAHRPPGRRRAPGRSPRPRRRAVARRHGSAARVSPAPGARASAASSRSGSSQWTSSMPAGGAGRRERSEQRRVVDAEVVDHERLGRRHAGGDGRRSSAIGSSWRGR